MKRYDKEFREQALKLSDEVETKKTSEQSWVLCTGRLPTGEKSVAGTAIRNRRLQTILTIKERG